MPSRGVDCVVLDMQMPGLNGLQVQEHLTKAGQRLPVVFITAHDDSGGARPGAGGRGFGIRTEAVQ